MCIAQTLCGMRIQRNEPYGFRAVQRENMVKGLVLLRDFVYL